MANFILIRHGTTDWVDIQRLHGITDIPLNQKGRAQALETARALRSYDVEKIYTSSLSRCVETAQLISEVAGLDPLLMDDLVELDFGWLEGRKIRDHDQKEYGKLIEFYDHYVLNIVRTLSGEPKIKFRRRVLQGWQTILSENQTGNVFIVGHSGVFNVILLYLFGKKYLSGNSYHHLNPCGITEIRYESMETPELVRLNDRNHLSESNL